MVAVAIPWMLTVAGTNSLFIDECFHEEEDDDDMVMHVLLPFHSFANLLFSAQYSYRNCRNFLFVCLVGISGTVHMLHV